jgi:hypothetical protein
MEGLLPDNFCPKAFKNVTQGVVVPLGNAPGLKNETRPTHKSPPVISVIEIGYFCPKPRKGKN